MHNIVRFVLIISFAGAATTLLAGLWAWWNEEDRRLRRLARRVLGGEPDATIIARGRNSAAAFRLAGGEVLVMRRGGASALLYPMRLLVGAELIVDGEVVGRAVQGEARRALDRIAAEARRVSLRLIFDNAAHPDFNLDLWLPEDGLRRDARPPAVAIQEARGWLARAEAILRRPEVAASVAREKVQAATPPAEPPPKSAAHITAPETETDDAPPWDDGPVSVVPLEQGAEPAPAFLPPPAPAPRKPARSRSGEDGEPLPPLDEPIQPYLL